MGEPLKTDSAVAGPVARIPLLGEAAPAFGAATTQGLIR